MIIATSPQVLDQELRSSSGVLLQTARDMGARRIFIDNVALLGAMASQNHAPPSGNGHASAREIFQHLLDGLRREELTGLLAHETGTHADGVVTLKTPVSDRGTLGGLTQFPLSRS